MKQEDDIERQYIWAGAVIFALFVLVLGLAMVVLAWHDTLVADRAAETFPLSELSAAERKAEIVTVAVKPMTVTVHFQTIPQIVSGWAAVGGTGEALAYSLHTADTCDIYLPATSSILIFPKAHGGHGSARATLDDPVFTQLLPHELAHCLVGSWHGDSVHIPPMPRLRTLNVVPLPH
jgi:hypothetical protein